jgi:hypothetical protein
MEETTPARMPRRRLLPVALSTTHTMYMEKDHDHGIGKVDDQGHQKQEIESVAQKHVYASQ